MNRMIQLKTITSPLLITLTLLCFGLLLRVEAVVPAPDGGYPGFNTAEGQNALLSLTTGGFNTAVGWLSLRTVTTGQFNTAVGAGTLVANTADQNTATGAGALLSNTTGTGSTADGAFALFSNTEGNGNTATGNSALFTTTTGSQNTAIGAGSLYSNTTGVENTGTGFTALDNNTTGSVNTAYGAEALKNNISGDGNSAIGWLALSANTSGSDNIALGGMAGQGVSTADRVTCIAATGENVSDSCYIGRIFGATSSGGTAVFINSIGKLGTAMSSRRFKEQIKPMAEASEALFALKPVTFRYKKEIDSAGTSQFGLVAEDVEKINPDLVVRDKEGKVYSVRYDAVNAMLLNEFLKEHRKVEALQAGFARQEKDFQATVAQQQKQIEELTAAVQKVSAQLALSKPAPQIVNDP